MQLMLLTIAVWFGLELLLMAVLFALAAYEDRKRARNARSARLAGGRTQAAGIASAT